MYPVLFRIGPVSIYSWGAMVAVAFTIGLAVAFKEAKRVHISPQLIIDLAFYLLIGGLVFARLVYVLFNLAFYSKNPLQMIMVQEGGLAIHGALLGGVLVVWWFSRRNKVSWGRLLDVITPSIILGQAIGRIGCFLNGDSYGKVTGVFWAVNFSNLAGTRHPTQLYEAVLNLLAFLFIWKVRDRKRFDGQLFLVYLMLYSGVRFLVEIFRESQILYGPITMAQAASLAIALVSYVILKWQQQAVVKSS